MAARPRACAAIGLALAIAACAPAAPRPEDLAPLVFPEPPDAPRVAYVTAITHPEDAGIRKGLGDYLAAFVFGATHNRLVRPMAVVESRGAVFVADPGAHGVHRFDRAAGRYDLIGLEDGGGLPSPVGLARGRDGEVYVADSALPAVLVIRPGSRKAVRLALPPLEQPTGIAYDDASGRLIVVDTRAHALKAFNADGTLHRAWGARGSGDGEFNYPTQLWRDREGLLYITDSLNYRVQVLDRDGRFLRKFGRAGDGAGDFMRQKGLATDSHGHLYIVDALLNAIQIFDPAGELLLSVGDLGRGRGEFWLPAGIFISEDDTIYVADSYNRRIQVFRYIGGTP